MEKLKQVLQKILNIIITIATLFAFYYFFRWVGWKGGLSMIIGMFIMAYLLLSKNAMVMSIIDMTSSETYINDLRGQNEEKEN